jgi:exo-1,4-beta-D-glucosaminidase
MTRSPRGRLAAGAALLLLPGVLTVAVLASAEQADAADIQIAAAMPHGLSIIGTQGWRVLTSATAKDGGEKISAPGYPTTGWLQVKPDDAGAPGTEINALVQNGKCPDVFYSDNMRKCFGYVDKLGPVTTDPFKDPWWYRTDFAPAFKPGQNAKLTIPGIVGEGDVWVNGTLVAGKDLVNGAFAGQTFDITKIIKPGKNTLAIKVYPNDPLKMYTLDQVDWGQIPPHHNTGIQYSPELQISYALTGDNAHVTQNNAADLGTSELTVKTDVTNNADTALTGEVTAIINPPAGGGPLITVKQTVTVAAHTKQTVSFTATKFGSLKIANPKLWWPYSMGIARPPSHRG